MSKTNLVFLGDSITAGVISGPELDYRKKGYAKYVAEYFKKNKKLGTYHNFAVSGFTTGDVLNQFKANITHNENIAFNVLSEKCYKLTKKKYGIDTINFTHPDVNILDAIQNAHLIVMTVGANDLIRLFKKISDESLTKVLHSIVASEYTQEALDTALKNFLIIINIILKINPQVEIIILGSYIPFGDPHIVNRLFSKFGNLDDALYGTIANEFPHNVTFVKTRDLFKSNSKEFVTSKIDIHPSTEGHKGLADLVLQNQTKIKYSNGEIYSYK